MYESQETVYDWTPERIREDRIASKFSHALVDAQEAARILGKGYPHGSADREKLAKAAKSLNAYLAELS